MQTHTILPAGDIVSRLTDLLGPKTLLLTWPRGTKGAKKKWAHLSVDVMSDPRYRARLAQGNIGVALGAKSDYLCSIDLDCDEDVEPFLELNPELRQTLRSRGKRGCNIWVRMVGPYPRAVVRLNRDGSAIGEWRADGGQTIIHGTHPEGGSYCFLHQAKPVELRYNQIQWPAGVIPPPAGCTERTEGTEESEGIEGSEEDGGGAAGRRPGVLSIAEAVELALPTEPHTNHKALFVLARALKTLSAEEDRDLSPTDLRSAFGMWYNKSREFLRQGQSKDEYLFEFLEAWEIARCPLGEDPLSTAWTKAQAGALPEAAIQFEDQQVRLLVALCFELNRLSAPAPFFLSARSVQRLFGLNDHARAARWLSGLCRAGVLEMVQKGGPKTMRASRYRYQHPAIPSLQGIGTS